VDLHGHGELPQQRQQARALALEERGLVQRDVSRCARPATKNSRSLSHTATELKPRLLSEASKTRSVRLALAMTSSIAARDSAGPEMGR
jgi:hypothetical protein